MTVLWIYESIYNIYPLEIQKKHILVIAGYFKFQLLRLLGMLRAGKHLNSLHCVGMSTDSTQFGQLAHLFFFPTLRQPKTLSVFGEEAKNFLLMTLQSISIITHLFVSEKNMENPLSTSNGLSQCRSCFFLNPQVMVRSSTLLPFMPCWTVGGPVWTPKPTSCETAQLPTHPTGKTCCKIGHQKSFK